MIKRIIGVLFTLSVIAAIVCAALEFGNYESMLFGGDDTFEDVDMSTDEEISEEVYVVEPDTLVVE